jgi:hypothetical protein
MKKKIIIASVTAIIAVNVVVYVKSSTVSETVYQPAPTAISTPVKVKVVHPLDRGDIKEVDLAIKTGPNKPLLVIEDDYIGQIKKMNTSGEYMNTLALIINLHAMTHQKIKADQIGFSVKMTPEMIDVMLENLKNSRDLTDQQRADFLSIAENWKVGDFSQIVKDHNYFWTLQGGTIGKATGIKSPEEESEFVKSYFATKGASSSPEVN